MPPAMRGSAERIRVPAPSADRTRPQSAGRHITSALAAALTLRTSIGGALWSRLRSCP